MGIDAVVTRIGWALAKIWSVVILVLAALASMSAVREAARPLSDWLHDNTIPEFALFLVQAIICIVIHELGHAAAARSVGWRVHSIAVGPFAYLPGDRRFVTVRRRQYVLSGFVTAGPTSPDRRERLHRAIVLVGGSAANFALTIVTLPFVGALSHNWEAVNAWLAPLGSLSMMSLILGIANLIPFGGFNGIRSDGLRLVDLLVRMYRPPQVRPSNRSNVKTKRKSV